MESNKLKLFSESKPSEAQELDPNMVQLLELLISQYPQVVDAEKLSANANAPKKRVAKQNPPAEETIISTP